VLQNAAASVQQQREEIMSLRDPNIVSKNHPTRVAIVIANPAISSTTQWPVGFWWGELYGKPVGFDASRHLFL
jgi:hypothetical protein